MRVLLVLTALVALASAQCNVQGNTYTSGSQSLTFGTAVDSWIPGLFNSGVISDVQYGTWTQATTIRWEVQTSGSASGKFCGSKGQYNLKFSSDCTTLSFTLISDSCSDRVAMLSNTMTSVARPPDADCLSAGTTLQTTLQSSTTSPLLSEEPATVVFGQDNFAIVSVGTVAALFQRWQGSTTGTSGLTSSIVDFGSVPAGLSCGSTRVGSYTTNWGTDCSVQFCGISDSCESRAELFQSAATNGFVGTPCPQPANQPGLGGKDLCSPNNEQWTKHPWDCTNQQGIPGDCFFCRGIANGETVSLCLDREGVGCNDLFVSNAARAYCNLAFECPASSVALSFVLLLSCLLVVFILH